MLQIPRLVSGGGKVLSWVCLVTSERLCYVGVTWLPLQSLKEKFSLHLLCLLDGGAHGGEPDGQGCLLNSIATLILTSEIPSEKGGQVVRQVYQWGPTCKVIAFQDFWS